MPEVDNKIIVALIALFAGIYGWLIKHLSNSKKHPCADKIVYSDVCKQVQRRLEDCIEAEVKHSAERYEALEKSIDEVKQLIRDIKR